MSIVRLPPVLRSAAGGQREIRVGGGTVGEVLEALYEEHPGMRSQLQGDDGALHRFVNLYVNDEDVKLLDWLETPVGDEDTLLILPAMAGGAGA
jgi:molybdopterin converting factor small subunit